MEVLTKSGFKKFDKVLNQGLSKILLKISFSDGSYLKCTNDHRILFDDFFLEAEQFEVGMVINDKIITHIEQIPNEIVYDLLNVQDTSHYLTNGVTSHNCSFLYIDECAFIEGWDEFYASTYPTITSGKTTKMLFTSCVPKDTLVFTTKGLQQIGDFVEDDKIGGYYIPEYQVQGHTKTRSSNVFHNDGKKDTIVFKTKSGEIESTHVHKFWAYKNKIGYGKFKAEELEVGDYLSTHVGYDLWGNWIDCSDFVASKSNYIKNIFEPKIITKEICYFLGLFLAEGCATIEYGVDCKTPIACRFALTCGDDISKAITDLGFTYSCVDNLHYTFSSIHLMQFMHYLGFDLSKKSKEKIIPYKLLQTSKENLAALLRGMFDGDGSSRIIKNGSSSVTYTSTSFKMMQQIKMLLMNFGIFPLIYDDSSAPTKKVNVYSYSKRIELVADEAVKFGREIGFSITRKQRNIIDRKTRKGGRADIIPNAYNILKQYNCSGIFNGMGLSKTGHLSRKTMLSIKNTLQNMPEELNEFFKRNVNENIKWEVIKEKKFANNDVYDFSLPDNDEDFFAHSVVYNGFIGFQTPRGLNHFHDFWKGATEGTKNAVGELEYNGFAHVKADWQKVPGRDEAWKEGILKALNYDMEQFAQEYECEFRGSSGTLLNAATLKELNPNTPIVKNESIRQYFQPEKDHTYVLCSDVSRGKGLDYSAFHVIDVTEIPYRQVCTFRNNKIGPTDFATVIHQFAKLYNDAYCLIENNDLGAQTIEVLFMDSGYENVLATESAGRAGKRIANGFGNNGKTIDMGIRTTEPVKRLGCSILKLLMEQRKLLIVDKPTIDEFNIFSKNNGTYKAEGDGHDDLVMGLVLFAWLTQDHYFKNLTDTNILQAVREKSDEEWFDDLTPFGVINSGAEEDSPKLVKFKGEEGLWQEFEPLDNGWGRW